MIKRHDFPRLMMDLLESKFGQLYRGLSNILCKLIYAICFVVSPADHLQPMSTTLAAGLGCQGALSRLDRRIDPLRLEWRWIPHAWGIRPS